MKTQDGKKLRHGLIVYYVGLSGRMIKSTIKKVTDRNLCIKYYKFRELLPYDSYLIGFDLISTKHLLIDNKNEVIYNLFSNLEKAQKIALKISKQRLDAINKAKKRYENLIKKLEG